MIETLFSNLYMSHNLLTLHLVEIYLVNPQNRYMKVSNVVIYTLASNIEVLLHS